MQQRGELRYVFELLVKNAKRQRELRYLHGFASCV
jgi:hypothetical protein